MRKETCQLFVFHAGNRGESQEHILNLGAAPIPALAWPWWLPTESREEPRGCGGQSPGALLASRLACCPPQNPGSAVICCPQNLGHASGKAIVTCRGLITSITGALWVRSSLCWLHYSPLICFPLS